MPFRSLHYLIFLPIAVGLAYSISRGLVATFFVAAGQGELSWRFLGYQSHLGDFHFQRAVLH